MAPVHLTGPIGFIGAFIAFNLVFAVYLSPLFPFLDACLAFFDTACNDVEKWAMGWNWAQIWLTLGTLGLLTFQAARNDNKLRRLCVYVNYMLFLDLGIFLFWGSKSNGNGVYSDTASRASFVACLVLLNVGSYQLRSGALSHAKGSPMKPSNPPAVALLVFILVLNAQIIHCALVGPQV